MTRKTLPVLMAIMILLTVVHAGLAQEAGLLFMIQGSPDATTAAPTVRTHTSVINEETAQAIEGLGPEDFQVQEAGAAVGPSEVSYESVGLGIVVVVDRGGIAAPGDPRIKEATDLTRELLDRLTVPGGPEDDMIAIVGVGEGGVLEPKSDFSYNPVDTNLVRNALVEMEGQAVQGGTPLYEGLDEALRMLTENADATIRSVLARRRRVVVVLSDGVDPNFSDAAREDDIIRKANAANVSLYTIGMAQRNGQLAAEENLVRLARQTDGLYQLHNNDETHQQVLDLFDRLMTQRNQYRLTYETRLPKGDYTLNVEVSTDIGSAEESATFSSILQAPEIALTAPPDGAVYSVPYSRTERVEVPLSVQLTFPDGVERQPSAVRYYRSGVLVATSTAAPFDASWDATDYVTPTEEIQVEDFTFKAEADDAYLPETMTSAPVNVQVAWEALPEPPPATMLEATLNWLSSNWWLLVILFVLALGLVVLLILLLRTRSEMARSVVQSTTGVLKGVTKRLSAQPQRAPGKLVVVQGANVGKEVRLASQVTKVGRDPQFCDFALYDDYTSNPHFSIQMEQNRFFITDEGSTNGTRLNGRPLQAHQRVVLPPDAIIEAGQTRLQFKRLGGTTRQLQSQSPPRSQERTQPNGQRPPV